MGDCGHGSDLEGGLAMGSGVEAHGIHTFAKEKWGSPGGGLSDAISNYTLGCRGRFQDFTKVAEIHVKSRLESEGLRRKTSVD